MSIWALGLLGIALHGCGGQVRLSINGTRVSVLLADLSYETTFDGIDFDLAESQ